MALLVGEGEEEGSLAAGVVGAGVQTCSDSPSALTSATQLSVRASGGGGGCTAGAAASSAEVPASAESR
jgi:hypothetical protein